MDDIEDIVTHAWNKDSDNLTAVVSSIMSDRANKIVNNMSADVAASMFGSTSAMDEHQTDEDE